MLTTATVHYIWHFEVFLQLFVKIWYLKYSSQTTPSLQLYSIEKMWLTEHLQIDLKWISGVRSASRKFFSISTIQICLDYNKVVDPRLPGSNFPTWWCGKNELDLILWLVAMLHLQLDSSHEKDSWKSTSVGPYSSVILKRPTNVSFGCVVGLLISPPGEHGAKG